MQTLHFDLHHQVSTSPTITDDHKQPFRGYLFLCLQENEFTHFYRQMALLCAILTCYRSFIFSIFFSLVISRRLFSTEEPSENSYRVLSITCMPLTSASSSQVFIAHVGVLSLPPFSFPSLFLYYVPHYFPLYGNLLGLLRTTSKSLCGGFFSLQGILE